MRKSVPNISLDEAKRIWLSRQGLSSKISERVGPSGVLAVIRRLGYVQIDTIHVIERAHHHILWSRLSDYKPEDLRLCLCREKTVFEYWTHALSYIPVEDFPFFRPLMKARKETPGTWFASVRIEDLDFIFRSIKSKGPVTIRDFKEKSSGPKEHPWASRKPSQRALQFGFLSGELTVSNRHGMVKEFELTKRHFGWRSFPKGASEKERGRYLLEKALSSQGLTNGTDATFLRAREKPLVEWAIGELERAGEILPVTVEGLEGKRFWVRPEDLEISLEPTLSGTHILSPFDPLLIQRKRLKEFFGLEYRFEAYVPKEKRKFGYFALPVLQDQRFIALLDIKADRSEGRLLLQQWTWLPGSRSAAAKQAIENQLDRFTKFQFLES